MWILDTASRSVLDAISSALTQGHLGELKVILIRYPCLHQHHNTSFYMFPSSNEMQDKYVIRDPHDSLMTLLYDELEHLDRIGCEVQPTNEQTIRIHAKLLALMSDLRGLQDFMKVFTV